MRNIVGVGLLLFWSGNGSPKMFTIKELKGKPELCKEKGMISFPLETYKEEDGSHHGTINRLLEEEVGISPKQVRVYSIISEGFNLIPGRKDIQTYYGYGVFLGDPDQSFISQDNDVVFAGWKPLITLSSYPLRVEVVPVLKHFLSRGHYEELLKEMSLLEVVSKF